MRVSGRLVMVMLALFAVSGAEAYPRMTFSQEPNDTPAQAQSVSGEARLVGEVAGSDRDLFWWALDDNETDRLWRIELQGNTEAGIEASFTWPAEETLAQPSGVTQFGAAAPEEAAAGETRLLSLEVGADRPHQQYRQLIVPPGEHLISLLPDGPGGEYQLTLEEAGELSVTGRAGSDEADELEVTPGQHWFFQLDVAEHVIPLVPEESELLWRLHLLGELGTPLEAWIENDAGERLAEVQADSPVQHQWRHLDLAAGGHLHLRHPRGETIGRVGLELLGDGQRPEAVTEIEAESGADSEAADSPADRDRAAVLLTTEPYQGHFQGHGAAWFDLLVGSGMQLWDIQAEADAINTLAIYHHGDPAPILQSQQPRGGESLPQRKLSPLRLLPGRYQILIEGDGAYHLEAVPLGRPEPGREMEPNDDMDDANPLWLGAAVEGDFHSEDDVDYFHFHLPGKNRLVMDFDPPAGGHLQAQLIHAPSRQRGATMTGTGWDQGTEMLRTFELDGATRLSRVLPAGDYLLRLTGVSPSQARYSVGLTLAAPWQSEDAAGPTRDHRYAPRLPQDGALDYRMTRTKGATGYLRLPVTAQSRILRFEHRWASRYLSRGLIRFVNDEGDELVVEESGEAYGYTVTVPGTEQWYLWVELSRNGLSELTLEDPALPFTPRAPPLVVELASDSRHLPPFLPYAQRIDTRLTVINQGEVPLELPLQAHGSHAGWSVKGLPASLHLEAGEHRELALDWTLPAQLLESDPPSLFVSVANHTGRHDLRLDASSAALDPQPVPPVPKLLDGLVDLGWNALGAHFVDPGTGKPIDDLIHGRRGQFLIDGAVSAGSNIQATSDDPLPPIRLAGAGGRVHGLAFNQRSGLHYQRRWREVEIALGDSLETLASHMIVALDSHDGEQFFPFEKPVEARYVRLRPLSLHFDPPPSWSASHIWSAAHGTGVVRVLGEPSGELAERRFDLLDRGLGGHWIYTLPDSAALYGFQRQRITAHSLTNEHRVRHGQPIRGRRIEMVFAFLQHRAARLDALRWTENLDWGGLPVEKVSVYTSLESPVGPWEHQADWALARDEEGRATLALPQAPRARYLRLVVDEPPVPEGERNANWRVPEALQVFEADTLGSGHSILGHWGLEGPRGPLEAKRGEQARLQVEDPDSHADAPWALEGSVVGRIAAPGDSRHYALSLEAPDNTLAFELEEPARDRLRLELRNADGELVPLTRTGSGSGRRRAEAVAIPVGDYRLTVTEPPRSIVFAWDASGSLENLQPAIYQALIRFAEGLEPGREVFNMLPLGGPLLIDGWATQPSQVASTLAAYDGRFSSSNSEPALDLASRALEQREGQRAIFLITDAEQTGRDIEAWETLARVRPRIFSLEISHGGLRDTEVTRWYQNQMLSWAQVADGRYHYSVDRTSLVRGFEAGMRELRRPSEFALVVVRRYQEPPDPGSLTVVNADPERPAVAAGVVHLIFDASGSMLRRMEGGRRIEVARRIVQQTLDERIPEDVPVALRAYGHTEPHSCETELLVAPEVGSHAEVREAVSRIQAINLARTPLAASLDAVLDDLAGFEGQPRLVVMLTDGEETCDGDVAASVDALIEEGIEIRLNIVGFHIDEIGLQAEFERFAARGGGEYFDSQDGDELIEGLAQALAAPWRVLDGAGEEVARGRVGDAAVELDAGDYELVVETQAGEWRRQFHVGPRQTVEIPIVAETGEE